MLLACERLAVAFVVLYTGWGFSAEKESFLGAGGLPITELFSILFLVAIWSNSSISGLSSSVDLMLSWPPPRPDIYLGLSLDSLYYMVASF